MSFETLMGCVFIVIIVGAGAFFAGGGVGFSNACRQAGAVEFDGKCLPRDVAFKIEGMRKAEKILVEEARTGGQ